MNSINYTSLTLVTVNVSAQKAWPVIQQNYHTKSVMLPYTVPMEYNIAHFIMDKLKKFKRINFEYLLEEMNNLFCIEAINGVILDTLLTKKGVVLHSGYLVIAKP
ncbi:MAG: hypothetical protein V4580_19980 [Bacteroidota bacterium]